ncbi:MAG: MtrB/PioB family outer membrane beta-barrel protein, partial [Deltaproteobacteria bacterium]|nr:MtrB/PioB family outer membrane beta-barrel protein [Deltaproteobacteria bacterium]
MKKKYLFVSFVVMVIGFSLLSGRLQAAEVTTLYNIRLGQHRGFTRLVFDAGGARPVQIGPATADSVSIVYTQVEFARSPARLFRDLQGAVANVSHQRAANQTMIMVTFSGPDTAVKSFYVQGKPGEKIGYRLILDFYPAGSALVGPGTLVAVAEAAPAPAASAAAAAPAVEPQAPVAAAAAAAQIAAPPGDGEDAEEEPSVAENFMQNFSGDLSLILRARNDDAKDSLFTQYRDPQSVSGEFWVRYEEKDRFVFKADGNNLGQDDVNVSFSGNWYGKIKGGITYDEIPHRFAFDART